MNISIEEMPREIDRLLEENERLQEELDKTRLSELDKEYRIDKAIEEIETELHGCKIDNIDGYADAFLRDLKNILKGSE